MRGGGGGAGVEGRVEEDGCGSVWGGGGGGVNCDSGILNLIEVRT